MNKQQLALILLCITSINVYCLADNFNTISTKNSTAVTVQIQVRVDNGSWTTTNSISICENSKVDLRAIPSDNAGSWSWSGPNGFTSNSRTFTISNSISSSQEGTYSVIYSAGSGSTYNANTTITIRKRPDYNNIQVQDATCSNDDGSITIFYDINPNENGVRFSINGGSTYPYNAPYTNTNTTNSGVPNAFDCRSGFYQVVNSITPGQLFIFDVTTSTYTPIGNSAGFRYNSIGYNTADNFIYSLASDNGGTDANGVTVNAGDLIKIDADGEAFRVGSIAGVSGSYTFAGEVYDNHMWVALGNQLYKVNLSNANVVAQMTLSSSLGADFVISYDWIYAITNNKRLAVGNLANVQNGQTIAINSYFTSGIQSGSHGAGWVATNAVSGLRELYFSYNTNGRIYRIDDYGTTSPTAVWVAQGQTTGDNDGAGCPTAQAGVFVGEDSYTIPNLPAGNYDLFAKWNDHVCPIDLANVTVSRPSNCIENCTDAIDNDGDGLADCADPDCRPNTPGVIQRN